MARYPADDQKQVGREVTESTRVAGGGAEIGVRRRVEGPFFFGRGGAADIEVSSAEPSRFSVGNWRGVADLQGRVGNFPASLETETAWAS